MKTNNKYFGAHLLAVACAALVVGAFVTALWLSIDYWHTVSMPCEECQKTFSDKFFNYENLTLIGLMLWSSLGLIRAAVFLRRENNFAAAFQNANKKSGNLFLVENAPLAAWSSGVWQPRIFVDKSFWMQLTTEEKRALLAHESSHVKNREPHLFFWLGLCISLVPLPFFMNGIRKFLNAKRIAGELAADKAAIAQASRKALGTLLQKAMRFETGTFETVMPGIGGMMHERVHQLIGHKTNIKEGIAHRFLPTSTLVGISLIVAYGLFFIEPAQFCAM
jgi:Zn-dependent protease with chaperone function